MTGTLQRASAGALCDDYQLSSVCRLCKVAKPHVTVVLHQTLVEPQFADCCLLQIVEDALCLVFLEHQFADLLDREGADKMVDIVKKTWGKMGEKGRAAALKLDLPADQAAVVQRALQ